MTKDMFALAEPPPEERRAEFDVDYTPPDVVHQILTGFDLDGSPNILDICAGAGCWSMVARHLWPDAHITAVELRGEEQPNLKLWADDVVIGDVGEAPRHGFDLIMGNPAFSLPDVNGKKSRAQSFLSMVVGMLPRLCRDGNLVLLVPVSWWHRSAAMVELGRMHPPRCQWNVTLPIQFRRKGGADMRCYAAYVWRRGHTGPWTTLDLPALPAHQRKWSVVPGTEPWEPTEPTEAA